MMEAISLDSKTIIIKSDNESDLAEVIDFVAKKDKRENINAFLEFAKKNRFLEKDYKFNRDECYDR